MQNVRLDPIVRRKLEDQAVVREQQQRVQLFTHSTFEAERKTFAGIGKPDLSAIGSSANGDSREKASKGNEVEETLTFKMKDGTRLELPRLTAEQSAVVEAILAKGTPEQRERLVRSSRQYAARAYEEVERDNAGGPYGLASTQAAYSTYQQASMGSSTTEQEKAMTDAIIMGVYGHEQNLRDFFQKIRDEQALANEMKTDVLELESMIDDLEEGETDFFDYREVVFNEDGSVSVIEHKNVEMTKEQAQELKQRLEYQIEALGKVETMDTYYLQMMVHRWQQATNTITNIMKQSHETMRGIIDKARA